MEAEAEAKIEAEADVEVKFSSEESQYVRPSKTRSGMCPIQRNLISHVCYLGNIYLRRYQCD